MDCAVNHKNEIYLGRYLMGHVRPCTTWQIYVRHYDPEIPYTNWLIPFYWYPTLIVSEYKYCCNSVLCKHQSVVTRGICWGKYVISMLWWHYYYIIISLSNWFSGDALCICRNIIWWCHEKLGRLLAINRGSSCLLWGDLNFAAYQCTLMYLR